MLALGTSWIAVACRSVAPLPPLDLGQPGWQVRQGQATWQTGRHAPEIAGELLVATGPRGEGFIQFTKTPLPFVVAQIAAGSWQIEFSAENRRYSGRGTPPSRLGWFQLLNCLRGEAPGSNWKCEPGAAGHWRIKNESTGEIFEGYLVPASTPTPP
jgi:hypothetical protein